MSSPYLIESTWDEHDLFAPRAERWARHVVVRRCDEYDILVDPGLIHDWAEIVKSLQPGRPAAWVVTDRTVWGLHEEEFLAAQGAGDLVKGVFVLEPGEASKSLERWQT